MEWSERMNAAVDYLEENLAGEIDYNKAADRAFCSLFHFQHIFLAVTGTTPAEYVRRRRLTLAARELSSDGIKVIDIAMKYGYDSPDSFTRAFRNVHGVTPLAARKPGVSLVAFPRVSFHVILRGGSDMDYRIIEKPAFKVIGKAKIFSMVNGENFIKIPQFWDDFIQAKYFEPLEKLTSGKAGTVTEAISLGVCIPGEPPEFTYAIGIEKPDGKTLSGYDVFAVPAVSWAVFDVTGLNNLQPVTKQIFSEWFPSTGYEHATAPEVEVYLPGDVSSPDYRMQIWIPIIKKKK